MRRRDFIAALSGAAVFAPLTANAQDPGRTYRIGALLQGQRDAPQHVAFRDELRRAGFIEGQNLAIVAGSYGQRLEHFAQFAQQMVKDQVDVILAAGDSGIRAAQLATATVPILGLTDDMVGSRLVGSLAHPEGNTTGVSLLATELDGKRQEILIEAVPGLSRLGTLVDSNTTAPLQLQALKDAAQVRGVELLIHQVQKPEEIASAIEAAKTSGAHALNALASGLLFNNRQIIFERVATLRLPAMYQWPEVAEEGGFIGYGPRIVQLYRDVLARQLVKLLRGAKPADIPVEQPTKFELVINLKTAKALSVALSESFLQRADKVIE
jgi:putative ABC transport system substrate-binding protein